MEGGASNPNSNPYSKSNPKPNPKAGITRSSFLYNLFASRILELSHLDAIFLKNFLQDGSIWFFRQANYWRFQMFFFALKAFTQ